MSIPLYCAKCGDIIGMEAAGLTLGRLGTGNFDSSVDVSCPGRGNHHKSVRTKHQRLWGLITDVSQKYPETLSVSSWSEYSGPRSLFCLWLACLFSRSSTRGLVINHKWVWWGGLRRGFYGDGLEEMKRPQPLTPHS